MNHKLFGREIPARLGAFLHLENRSIHYLKTSAQREFLARNPHKLTMRPAGHHRLLALTLPRAQPAPARCALWPVFPAGAAFGALAEGYSACCSSGKIAQVMPHPKRQITHVHCTAKISPYRWQNLPLRDWLFPPYFVLVSLMGVERSFLNLHYQGEIKRFINTH